MKFVFTFFLTFIMTNSIFSDDSKIVPIPLPKQIRVQSSLPRGKVWEKLTPNQKKLAYHLSQAGIAGRPLLIHQIHRHGLPILKMLTTSLTGIAIQTTRETLGPEAMDEYLLYTAKFHDLGGPYANSNRKYVLKKVTKDQLEKLFKRHNPDFTGEPLNEAIRLMTDPTYEVQLLPESPDGTGLEKVGGNIYERGITGPEVKAVLDKSLATVLNCRVVRSKKGLECEKQTVKTKGVVGEQLKIIISHLEKAKNFSESDLQKKQIDHMIKYFKDGEIEDFRQANIAWVRDGSKSPVDFMIGWVEVYEDWLARIGTWESYVQIIDPEVSKQAQALATHAQYFEDSMPYGKFKKKFPSNYSPPAIMVYYFQELANYRSGGYNLPNFDDIRRDVGAKNVIRLPMPGETEDPDFQDMWREALTEFFPKQKIESALKNRELVWRVLVLLHEIIGHGSGTYDEAKYAKGEDPISGLGTLGSALEEQRADLTALVFGGDKKLVDVGIYKSEAEAKEILNLMYDFYLFDFLRRTSGQRTFTEAHQRGHWLFIHRLLSKGAIKWSTRDGKGKNTDANGILVVKDYGKFHTVAKELLGELQSIKANRDEKSLKRLFETEAPLDDIHKPWAVAIIKRGEPLKINAGYVEQPWRVSEDGKFEVFGSKTLESVAPYWK
jgi:dipeptidyl-peptidase III